MLTTNSALTSDYNLLPHSPAGSFMTNLARYRNRKDLEKYYIEILGREKLDTFLLPDIDKIKKDIKEKKIKQQSSGDKDEFEHMTNWKRVFNHIWNQVRWL